MWPGTILIDSTTSKIREKLYQNIPKTLSQTAKIDSKY